VFFRRGSRCASRLERCGHQMAQTRTAVAQQSQPNEAPRPPRQHAEQVGCGQSTSDTRKRSGDAWCCRRWAQQVGSFQTWEKANLKGVSGRDLDNVSECTIGFEMYQARGRHSCTRTHTVSTDDNSAPERKPGPQRIWSLFLPNDGLQRSRDPGTLTTRIVERTGRSTEGKPKVVQAKPAPGFAAPAVMQLASVERPSEPPPSAA
jgi:hypothetical protein